MTSNILTQEVRDICTPWLNDEVSITDMTDGDLRNLVTALREYANFYASQCEWWASEGRTPEEVEELEKENTSLRGVVTVLEHEKSDTIDRVKALLDENKALKDEKAELANKAKSANENCDYWLGEVTKERNVNRALREQVAAIATLAASIAKP